MSEPRRIHSRANPWLVQWRKLVRDPTAYRSQGRVWIEGEHLCSALRQRALQPVEAVVAESTWQRDAMRQLAQWAPHQTLIPDALFDSVSALGSSAGLGFVVALPDAGAVLANCASVVLDRVQDAGNVGSILRTAAAFGVRQVLALRGSAGLWSTKVLRAGMGAHFGLQLHEGLNIDDLAALELPWIGTGLASGKALHEAVLPHPCAWIFGHEGQGVDALLLGRCAQVLRIPQPGGEESLNVAAAAAVCLYESMRQRA